VLQVRGSDGETEVDIWWLHELLQVVVVMDMIIIVQTLMVSTRF
jgi:hypothetical protein